MGPRNTFRGRTRASRRSSREGGGLGLFWGLFWGLSPLEKRRWFRARPGSGSRQFPHEHGAVRGREEAAAGGREAAQVHGVVVAAVVLRGPGGAGLQPQQPGWGGERLRAGPEAPTVPVTLQSRSLGLSWAATTLPWHSQALFISSPCQNHHWWSPPTPFPCPVLARTSPSLPDPVSFPRQKPHPQSLPRPSPCLFPARSSIPHHPQNLFLSLPSQKCHSPSPQTL